MIKITFLVMVIVMGAESLTVDEALSKLMPCMEHWMACLNPAEKSMYLHLLWHISKQGHIHNSFSHVRMDRVILAI